MSPICLHKEAIRLQYFTPTRYVKNGEYPSCTHITLMTLTRFAQNSTVGSMFALYGSTMHLAMLKPYPHARSYTIRPDRVMDVISKFFRLVCRLPCYTLTDLSTLTILS